MDSLEAFAALVRYSPERKDLPKRSSFVGGIAWLRAVRDCLGENVTFALDEALMCAGLFLGRNEEYLVWVYGDDSVTRYNGVAVLGNNVPPNDVEVKNGLKYTSFNRTLNDAIRYEHILDMQGITEALSMYYFTNGESFDGLDVEPSNRSRFELLARDAIEYYVT